MEETTNMNLFELQIDHQAAGYLGETAKWTKFLSILGFIFCGLIVLIAIFFGSFFSSSFLGKYGQGGAIGGMGSGLGVVVIVIYVLLALFYFFPCLYLFNFSNKMQMALRNNDQAQLNLSFKNLKSCFKFWGIFTIIILSFYALAIIISMFARV